MRAFSAVVLGAGGVGKSALTVRFVRNTFADSYDPTIEETYRKTMRVDGELCMLEVLDTAGNEQFTAINEIYIQYGASGFVLVFRHHNFFSIPPGTPNPIITSYSLTQESSMREVEYLRHHIYRIKGVTPPSGSSTGEPVPQSPLPIVIVGTKSDLISEREVSRSVMAKCSQQWGCPFYETSAKNNWNVTEVFDEIVRQMRAKIPEDEIMRKKKRKGTKCVIM